MTEANPNLNVNTINAIALNSKVKGPDSQKLKIQQYDLPRHIYTYFKKEWFKIK